MGHQRTQEWMLGFVEIIKDHQIKHNCIAMSHHYCWFTSYLC